MTREELYEVNGGAITASLLNAVARVGSFIYNIGVSCGKTFYNLIHGRKCF